MKMTFEKMSGRSMTGASHRPSARADNQRDSNFHLPSQKDQETAAICFALLSFFSPVLIGGIFYAIIKALS